jgi:Zn-dependent protease with chaperone function
VAPVSMNVIEAGDYKGFEREHRPTRVAALRGAVAGALAGVAIFGILLAVAGVNLFALRYLALYACGIAMCCAGGATIFALWNMGVSHDEALLYEEVQEKHSVIAAIEVPENMERQIIHSLEDHGARDVRSGDWQPTGWTHLHPTCNTSA